MSAMQLPCLVTFLFFLCLQPGAGDDIQFRTGNHLVEHRIVEEESVLFPCNNELMSKHPPASAHTLKPSDIKIFAALGSFKIMPEPEENHNLFHSIERRLIKASETIISGLIHWLNPSVSKQYVLLWGSPESGFDSGTLWDQVRKIVDGMKMNQKENFLTDWKLITIFLSPVDPCHFCLHLEDYVSKNVENLTRVLDYLQQELPRAFVSLVDLTDVTTSSLSLLSHTEAGKLCECFEEDSRLKEAILRWSLRDALEKLLKSGRYESHGDFTVTLQPFLRKTEPTNWREKESGNTGIPQVQCSLQGHPYLITYQNSNYTLGSDVPRTIEDVPQERKYGTNFSCSDRAPSDQIPFSVHSLRPADIKVIAAVGDSLTAGNGAGSAPNNILGVLTQYRGLSWTIGGDGNINTVSTLPNIFREFNPLLQGFSTGTGGIDRPNSFFNQAVPGAKARDIPTQVEALVNLMKTDSRVNFTQDWKLLTIFIGGNDLCDYCKDLLQHSPENYVNHLRAALDFLHTEVPRMFVNLISVLQITSLRDLYQDKRISCPRLLLSSLCSCVVNPTDNSTDLEKLTSFNRQYQEKTHQLVESGRYDTRDDFTVVVQPFLEKVNMPRTEEGMPDRSFFAPDCFHFSEKAHAQGARGLWNNMLEPLGEKTNNQSFDVYLSLICPQQDQPFLRTFKNSNYTYALPTSTEMPSAITSSSAWKPDEVGKLESVFGSELICTDLSPSSTPPVSVHALRPADVKVIAAMGDSITAGNGVGSKPGDLLDLLTEYRGLSWSIGGDASLQTVTTLANILRVFNPNLTGYATGTGKQSQPNAFLNQAVPEAKADDMPDQARKLIALMKSNSRINYQNDWKVITLFIGVNDLCNYCKDSNYHSPLKFSSRVQEALDILHKEVPRAFVNLVEVMNITFIRKLFLDKRLKCPALIAESFCPCVLKIRDGSPELKRMLDINRAYQHNTWKLIDSGRYDSREDFTVVLQPFSSTLQIVHLQDGRPDVSFFAPDCFHLSQKSHSQFSRAFWNNMLQPLGKKTDNLHFSANLTLGCPTQNDPFLRTYKNSNYSYSGLLPTQKPIENWGSDLSCPHSGPSESIPTSVHKLRPADIKVVAALGDSLTAGFGLRATNLGNLSTEWRGLSWSAGGDGSLETETTLPNILKKFNPGLRGFSIGTGKENKGFNMAVSGSKAQNMPAQAGALVNLMRSSVEVQFKKDWKLITLFIGGNDLCQYCLDSETYSVENYVRHIQAALDILYNEVPRAFVNVVEIMEIHGLRQINQQTLGCTVLKPNLCSCFINPSDGSPELNEIKRVNRDFQLRSSALIHSGRYASREDFTVVVQPFFRNTIVPLDNNRNPDLSFFSVDCFHFSERGHTEMAIALWNNMLEPVGLKQDFNDFSHNRSKLKCPTAEKPYIFTMKNSGLPEQENPPPTPPKEGDTVPFWVPIVAGVSGVLVGAILILVYVKLRPRRREKAQTQAPAVAEIRWSTQNAHKEL
uniref:Phospholipase B1, membrane-associated n=1 Tax=Geotrypetes seraphini TaxID=260995 RepID=A0A6P8R4G1_GEOSA|nr:phospholipase B1, membrane-associated [Geotrypetes seraphini]